MIRERPKLLSIRERIRTGRRINGLMKSGQTIQQIANEHGYTIGQANDYLSHYRRHKYSLSRQSAFDPNGPVAFYRFERFGSADKRIGREESHDGELRGG